MENGKTKEIKSPYDEAQEILSEINEDWADRLQPCGTGESDMQIGDAIQRFNAHLRDVENVDAKKRQQMIASLL